MSIFRTYLKIVARHKAYMIIYLVILNLLGIMDPAVLSDIVASRSSAQDASVSFTPSASGTATIVDASGATVWTGTVSAGVPASASLPGIGLAAASLTVRMGSIVYPSSATPTWYNTAAGCSAQVDVPAFAYVISFDGNGSGSGSMSGIRTYLATVFLLIPSLAAMLLSEPPRACVWGNR